MSPFRRVDARQAQPDALGILIPPGETTVVIVRPRSLPWDLVPAHWNGASDCSPAFCQFTRDEAAQMARRFHQALESASARQLNPIETFGAGNRVQIWARVADLVWILCRRQPGESYRPATFSSQEEAAAAAERLIPYLCPSTEAPRELYFNTQKFGSRP